MKVPRYPQHPVCSGHRRRRAKRLDTSDGSQSLVFASKFAPLFQGWRPKRNRICYPGNGKDVQPLAAWQRCSSSRLARSRTKTKACLFQSDARRL